ncbi:MAG: RsmE family RNA methyltransferase [Syntrophobacteraceae bacterium]|nr:16S rRNA (uracil(1498)-N(3))-methyltransferase [Desulfobacteraceae bacterium]
MTRKCFYIEDVEADGGLIPLDSRLAHQIEGVLRMRPGDFVEVRDGKGGGWKAAIEDAGGGKLGVRLLEKQHLHVESPVELTLALAFSRADRMETVVRQATELGVHRFVTFRAQRSQYGLSGPQAEKRVERWSKIAREALCQCGRTRVPEMTVFSGIDEFRNRVPDWGSEAGGTLRILACEEKCEANLHVLRREHPACGRVLAVVGPEGGWTAGELDLLNGSGFRSVHMGPRILRLETAAIALLSLIQLLWGDFGDQ